MADDGHDRDAERGFEALEIDVTAARAQLVDHRQHETGGLVARDDLPDQHHRTLERTGVRHHDERVGRGDAGHAAIEHRVDDGFVRRERIERIRPREIDRSGVAFAEPERTLTAFDRHPRIVADLRAQPGERVEERGLAGVGTPDQTEAQLRVSTRRRFVHWFAALPRAVASANGSASRDESSSASRSARTSSTTGSTSTRAASTRRRHRR